jgi:DNA polymerase-3 subunit alpha
MNSISASETRTAAAVGQFVHLRMHSEFSISDGMVRLDQVVARAAEDGQGAVALTDLSNLFGLIRFYKEARGSGVKPVAGCDVWISNPDPRCSENDRSSRLLLLVRNSAGYLRLCQLLSRAWLENQVRGRPEILLPWLEQGDNSGLIALSGAQAGDIGLALANDALDVAERHARRWADLFPNAFYIEVQRYGQAGGEAYIGQATQLAVQLQLPVVATHPVQFLDPDEYRAHEARVCIAEGEILANPRRTRRFTTEQYFKSRSEMAALFADLPVALENSIEIAKRCNLTLTLGKPRLPLFPTPPGKTLDDYLVDQARAGLEQRLAQLFPDPARRETERPRYDSRLVFETDTIVKMGFPGYFLIVADFIGWAKNNGVPVGPGRGSGVGSLVAYSLGITDLDPLAYNLLFERFLNPERVSMPDFDIDFCQEGRDRVIDYVKQKYGAECVAQIATFGTMAAKAAVRDIGRVLDLPFNFVDGIAKLIPFKPGKLVTLADARKEEPLLAEREQNEDEVRELIALAERVEGMTRNVGMHAGGVLIAPGELTDFCPLYTQSGSDSVVSQYDKDDVEAAGLVKFDFLGLTTLTILNWASQSIRRLYPEHADFALDRLPIDDKASYALLQRAETVAVFQLESRGMQVMLKDAKPNRFEDIIALVALYRPGPMDLIPDYIAHKKGEKFEYPDPRVKGILEETYGIMVYQEQVMQMAQIIGGYSLGGADLLRRAMGKKKAEEMATHRAIFAEGAAKNGLTAEKAGEIFDVMEKFAGYGFNKSHAAAYALLAYHTAYLKAHFPAEFMAANLSAASDDTDKVKILFEDCVVHKLTILGPDVNVSDYRFTPVMLPGDEKRDRASGIRFGLGAVKGTGRAAIESIVAARSGAAGKPFTDLFDFCHRVDKRAVNRRVLEALVRAGAFDSIDDDRGSLLASVGRALEAAEQAEANINQVSLFGGDDASSIAPEMIRVARWSDKKKLTEEKIALGFYLSGHLFHAFEGEVRRFARTRLSQIQPNREPQLLAGIISGLRTQMTRRGKMVIVVLDDATAQVEVTVFNELYEANRQRLREDELLIVQGQVRKDDFSGGLRISADRVLDLTDARCQYARGLSLSMNGQSDSARLKKLLSAYRVVEDGRNNGATPASGCPVSIRYHNRGVQCELALGSSWLVRPDEQLVQELGGWLDPANVQLIYL